jgi:hypothetical protein
MPKNSSDINRASLDLTDKGRKSTYICVCILEEEKI